MRAAYVCLVPSSCLLFPDRNSSVVALPLFNVNYTPCFQRCQLRHRMLFPLLSRAVFYFSRRGVTEHYCQDLKGGGCIISLFFIINVYLVLKVSDHFNEHKCILVSDKNRCLNKARRQLESSNLALKSTCLDWPFISSHKLDLMLFWSVFEQQKFNCLTVDSLALAGWTGKGRKPDLIFMQEKDDAIQSILTEGVKRSSTVL